MSGEREKWVVVWKGGVGGRITKTISIVYFVGREGQNNINDSRLL